MASECSGSQSTVNTTLSCKCIVHTDSQAGERSNASPGGWVGCALSPHPCAGFRSSQRHMIRVCRAQKQAWPTETGDKQLFSCDGIACAMKTALSKNRIKSESAEGREEAPSRILAFKKWRSLGRCLCSLDPCPFCSPWESLSLATRRLSGVSRLLPPPPTSTPPPYLQMTGLHVENPKVMTKPNTQPLEPTSEISKSQDLIVAQKINHVYTLKTNT